MTLIITGDDVKRLLTMKECIEAMRLTFQDFSDGIAVSRPLEQGGCKEIPIEWLGSDLSEYIAAGFRPSP